MTAIKQWVPNELLKSADLNGAFATAAQGYMPGVMCGPGAGVPLTAASGSVELLPGTPTAGNDQGGYWNPATSRIVVPVGLGGLHLISYGVSYAAGSTAGDFANMFLNGGGGQPLWFARASTLGAVAVTIVQNLLDGGTLWVTAGVAGSGATLNVMNLRVIRLASFGLFK